MSLDLSIIVVNYNSDAWLRQCLRSVCKHIKSIAYEIIVVDNGSNHDKLHVHQSQFPEIKTLRSDQQNSLAKAVNEGIGISSGRYILWLNPDVIFLNESIGDWIDFMEDNPAVGVSGPKVYDDIERQQLQYSCRRFPSLINSVFNRNSLLTKLFPQNRISKEYLMSDWDHRDTQAVDWVSGCCMLLKREMLEQVGLLDESFPLFCEDIDICLRAHNAGWQVVYFSQMEITHFTGSVRAQSPFRAIVREHQSLWRYYKKHFDHFVLFQGAVFVAFKVRMLFRLAVTAAKRHLSPRRPLHFHV